MRSGVWTALLCTVVVLSGCQFLGDGGATTTTTRDTYGVPATSPATTAPTTTTPSWIVPGLTAEGVIDPNALAAANEASLRGRNYTLLRTITHTYANGTLRTRRAVRAEFGSDRESYRYRTAVEGAVPAFMAAPRGWREIWSNGSATYAAVTEANATAYASELGGRNFVPQYDRFLVLFDAVETELSGRSTQNGTTVYRVESTSAARPGEVPAVADFRRGGGTIESVTDVSLVAWIDDRGTVRRYRLTYVATLDGTPIHVTETGRVTGVGTTTIERPPWLPAAINRTGAAPHAG